MQLSDQDINRLANESVAALQQGRLDEARAKVEAITQAGAEIARIWLLLATVCRAQRDAVGEEAALDRMLALEPQSVRGLIMKADCRLNAADDRIAANLYKSALRFASAQEVPPAVVPELQRAQAAIAQLEARFAAHLEEVLTARGLPAAERSPRFQQSLDIMAGRKHIYLQEPTAYYFPELPQIQFFDPAPFDWVPAIEAATGAIREELQAALADRFEGFRPYIRSEENQPRSHPLLDRQDWSALFFCENGRRFEDVIAACPRTWAALQSAPLPWIEDSQPTVMFSLLRGGTRIPAHNGMLNTRLVCHLPLIVPTGCGFRVGNETRQWEEGRLLVFDDTIEHEAWNNSAEDRVVLIFDIWRPELSESERREIAAFCSIPGVRRGASDG